MVEDAELDEMLRLADPVQQPVRPELLATLATLRDDIRRESVVVRVGQSSRRRRGVAVLCLVGIVSGGAGVAVASGLFARTGRQAAGGEDGTGEVIRPDASDAPVVIAQLGAGVPLPPGISIDDVVAPLLGGEPRYEAESGLRASIEFVAACKWVTYWLASNSSGDTAAMADAQAVLDTVPSWPALLAADGGGVIEMWRRIGAAAQSQDLAALNAAGYRANCTDT